MHSSLFGRNSSRWGELATSAKSAMKSVIDRTRPERGEDPELWSGDSDAHGDNFFPSGHSAGAVAVAQAFARSYPEHAAPARAAALAIAAVQLPRRTHCLGDVVAGTVIGLAAGPASEALIEATLRGVRAQLRSGPCPAPPLSIAWQPRPRLVGAQANKNKRAVVRDRDNLLCDGLDKSAGRQASKTGPNERHRYAIAEQT